MRAVIVIRPSNEPLPPFAAKLFAIYAGIMGLLAVAFAGTVLVCVVMAIFGL